MPRVLLIGNHFEFKCGMEASKALAGCEIVTAAGNVDAVHCVRARAIDVVITGPETPVQDDLTLREELRSSRPGLKAIVLAPVAAPGEIIATIRSHVFACFVASFDVAEFADMTKCALEAVAWRHGICMESGLPNWISLKVSCVITAERLVRFMTEYATCAGLTKTTLMLAFRKMLNAMEHGAGFDPEKVVEVTAVRTERAIVYHFRDPGAGSIAASSNDLPSRRPKPTHLGTSTGGPTWA